MENNTKIHAIKVKQWLSSWNDISWSDNNLKRRPLETHMHLFSISAKKLKKLSGVFKRDTKSRNFASDDLGIQRKHDPERSQVIRDYVQNGYPWSELSQQKRSSGKFDDLKKPGWLPTAIVLNILIEDDIRNHKKVNSSDLIQIESIDDNLSALILPKDYNNEDYLPADLPPIEVIDGQHRLWAFDTEDIDDDYELPVIAFHGLGLSWQAYLFYTINISPKKINRSLAFDLYPLLRNEEWLERFDGHNIYRETRAQELVDMLNSHKDSPWNNWIDMLGENENGIKKVSQSAWIRTLTSTFIKSSDSNKIGGLFGAPIGSDQTMLPWGKEEQAAIIIYFGKSLLSDISKSKNDWCVKLRKEFDKFNQSDIFDSKYRDPAFYAKDSLLNQDQGVRVLLHLLNDFLYINNEDLDLDKFYLEYAEGNDGSIVSNALQKIENLQLGTYIKDLTQNIANYDWRSFNSKSIGQNEELKLKKASFRGSGGYKVLRGELLKHLANVEHISISKDAQRILALV
ncbi:DGQHR domain-containing protein [Sphingobacterium faecium]|uniref:DGQHR domain-containing protein n=1 Tax=Sphingobacterium faecium TaxID=34087 RepID=UPI00320AE36F